MFPCSHVQTFVLFIIVLKIEIKQSCSSQENSQEKKCTSPLIKYIPYYFIVHLLHIENATSVILPEVQ